MKGETQHYEKLRRNIVGILAVVALAPVLLLAAVNYAEFQASFTAETQAPFISMVGKGKNSFELFLAERSSTVSLIASAYSFEELSTPQTLRHIFQAMQSEFTGFTDVAVISEEGILVAYAGPGQQLQKELMGKDYSQQEWFHKVQAQNRYVSEVIEGYRQYPHVLIAVQRHSPDGRSWVVRAAIDTTPFSRLIADMSLEPGSDAFLVNRSGVLQTDSVHYGKSLAQFPLAVPPPSYEASITKAVDEQGNAVLMAYSYLRNADYVLIATKPARNMLQSWLLLRTDILLIFLGGALCIYYVAAKSVDKLISRLRESDLKRDQAFSQMEHAQKLSSIGRMAAGVAHEINNPLAIINEKAGLMHDLLSLGEDFPRKEQFLRQIQAIHTAVARCRDITHRMLGFARRMEVKIESLDINEMLEETLLFFKKEAQHRNVHIVEELEPALPKIRGDRGQLQQVILNVLNNALAAVGENGQVTISTMQKESNTIALCIKDNGCGMSEETKQHIFEPFYTTKGNEGTGLGMSIIYGIIQRHHGEITVESELGKGTLLTICLPISNTLQEEQA